MIDSERSIYPLDSNKKKEKNMQKESLKNKQTSKTKVYQNLSIEKKKQKKANIQLS